MKEYCVYLINNDDLKFAGLISIDPSGVLVIKGNKNWNYGIFKNVNASLKHISMKEALYKKYNIDGLKEKLPEYIQRYEARKMSLDINCFGLTILGHSIHAYPVIKDEEGKFSDLKYTESAR